MSVEIAVSQPNEIAGIAPGLKKIITAAASIVSSDNAESIINSTVCRGILQNDINIAFTNNWNTNAYKGLMDSFNTTSKGLINSLSAIPTPATKVLAAGLGAVKGTYDAVSTLTNMGGMSVVGTGAGTTKIYGGSGISSFNLSMKWYTPVDKSYSTALQSLMILGFPSLRKPYKNSSNNSNLNTGDGLLKKLSKFGGGMVNTLLGIKDSLATLLSFNPPAVKVTIYSGTNKVFNIYPLVITSINFHFSRETHNGIPVVIGADITFEFYQVMGNNGYANDDFKLAGVPIMGNLPRLSQGNN